jgi:hypothetical protein
MTVFVFADFGGKTLFGKGRELADSWGDKLKAITYKDSSDDTNQLISLGADEVLTCEFNTLDEWATMISEQVHLDSNSKIVLFPSDTFSNALMGMIRAQSETFAPFEDHAEMLDGETAGKKIGITGLLLRKKLVPGKVMLCSLRSQFFSPPYEDPSRTGKTRSIRSKNFKEDSKFSSYNETIIPQASDLLTVLVGPKTTDETKRIAEKLAEKYGGLCKKYSSQIEIIYGPCVAIEVDAKLRDLPEFQGELISISHSALPISSISDSSVFTREIDSALQNLLSS